MLIFRKVYYEAGRSSSAQNRVMGRGSITACVSFAAGPRWSGRFRRRAGSGARRRNVELSDTKTHIGHRRSFELWRIWDKPEGISLAGADPDQYRPVTYAG